DRARTHFTLLTNAAPPWQMSVSMSANGFPTYNGLGTMRHTWLANLAWYWTSQLDNVISDRYAARGLFSSNPQAPVPMAVEMARELLFWPLQYATDARISLREAHVVLNGQPATCVLVAPPLQEP